MSQALTSAIDKTQADLRMGRLIGRPAEKIAQLERRLAQLFKEQADETEQVLAIMHDYEQAQRPKVLVLSFPSGESGYRCNFCGVLTAPGRTICAGCRSDMEL
jgi:hypothetical protein